MATKKSYSRYFIILQEDEKGYSTSPDKLPSGYVKLENKNDKCKLCFYVQSLKKENSPYHMIVMCNMKDCKKIINLGELNIMDTSRSEVNFEFPAININNTGISAENICGAAVVKFIEKDVISILSGFIGSEVSGWKSFEVVQGREETLRGEENPEEIKKEEEVIEEPNKFEDYENLIEEQKEEIIEEPKVNEELRIEEDNASINEEEKKTYNEEIEPTISESQEMKPDEVEAPLINNEEEKIDFVENYENLDRHEDELEEEDNDYPKGIAGEFFKEIAEAFEEVPKVSREIKRCKWYKVPVKDMEDLTDMRSFNRYTVVYYPMINYYPYIKKHGYFLLGYKFDKLGHMKYIVYGIPGRKSKYEQPYGGKSGFVTWIPEKENEDNEDSMGHWLMFYDFKNNTIVIPVK